ncbi:tigger transposable element-derived protein 4-like [Rhipicephalus sanguineus]|uniref:tigger transposable element-derived protein 4-like n=1 Tax=Rhipicephalus sanguineus TaxID=34632 RepID=UPI0020C3273B|nr:tigger transposable element-derived protein 4-like [Rhipicephalus sanguineus]
MADGKPSAQTDGTKRKALDISTKRAILNELAQGAKNCELVKKYGVSKSTISTILKNKDKIISADANSTDRKCLRRAIYSDMEEALLKWFVDARAQNIPISGPMMLAKAKDFAFLLDFPDFCPGNGWLHRFKVHHGIVFKSIVGEAASASDQDVASWLEANRDTILSYAEQDVYNADETALFYQMLPGKTNAMKGDTCAGGKHSKVRVTALLCTNMDGSDRRVPVVIGKSKKPRCIRGYVPVRYSLSHGSDPAFPATQHNVEIANA